MDIDSLSNVAYTGSYNDLVDVPDEFNPKPHNHTARNIVDLDDNIETSFDEFIDILNREFEN